MTDAFIRVLFEQAHAAGLSDCQVYRVSGSELYASTDGSEVISEAAALCFEASAGGKTAAVYTENISTDEVAYLIAACRDDLSVLDAGASRPLYDGSGEPETQAAAFENFDPAAGDPACIRSLTGQMRDEIARRGSAAQRSSGFIRSAARTVSICNDRGLDVAARHSYLFAVFTPIHEQDGQMKTGYYFRGGSGLAALDLADLVRRSYEQVAAYTGAGRIETGTYLAVFRNEAASHILQSMAIFFAKDLLDAGRSRFQHQLGQVVASPLVTLVDDPHLPTGIFSMPFDAQGVPTARRSIIAGGVLRDLLCDLKTADPALGLRPGSCMRSRYNLPPEISASNLFIQPMQSPAADLLAKVVDGVYITEVSDYFPGHGLNLASGDFSLPAKGFVIKNGRLERPFESVTVAGNLYDFLRAVEGVGDDLTFGEPISLIPGMPFRAGAYGSPTLLVRGIKIAGA